MLNTNDELTIIAQDDKIAKLEAEIERLKAEEKQGLEDYLDLRDIADQHIVKAADLELASSRWEFESRRLQAKCREWRDRGEKAEARAERYAGAIRALDEWDGTGDDGWCQVCRRWYAEGHAPDCIKAEVEGRDGLV